LFPLASGCWDVFLDIAGYRLLVWVERRHLNREVRGSNPRQDTLALLLGEFSQCGIHKGIVLFCFSFFFKFLFYIFIYFIILFLLQTEDQVQQGIDGLSRKLDTQGANVKAEVVGHVVPVDIGRTQGQQSGKKQRGLVLHISRQF
jgi:hypothetical protein